MSSFRSLEVIACGALAGHVRDIAARRGWPVAVRPLPAALHNRPQKIVIHAERAVVSALRAGRAVALARLAGALGNPERAYPVIHLTGTNGKGSTAAMIASLLRGRGLRVGAYTSPHISRVAERIAVDGTPVADDDLATAVGEVRQASVRAGVTPSWFEAVTAAGLWLLAAARVDVAVIEVGMLGRWDATNVADGSVAVVTNVQLDHTDVAGPTRAAIAAEKAGIIKPGATLVLGERDPGLRAIFEARHPARILTAGQEMTWHNRRPAPAGSLVDLVNPWGTRAGIGVGMIGAHQCDNALLALTAAEAFTGAPIPAAAVSAALGAAHVPGRFEIVRTGPVVALDGAHNPAAAAALRRAVEEDFASLTPRILLYGALVGRDPVGFLDQAGVRSAGLVVTTGSLYLVDPLRAVALQRPAGVLP